MNYSTKLKSNVINKEYEYMSINLLDLQKKIMEQENATRFDIMKGYHTNNEINLTYEYPVMYETKEIRDRVVEVLTKAIQVKKAYFIQKYEEKLLEKFEPVRKMIEEKLEGSSYKKMVNVDDVLNAQKYKEMDKRSLKTILGWDIIEKLDKLYNSYSLVSTYEIESQSNIATIEFINKELSQYGLCSGCLRYDYLYKKLPYRLKLDKENISNFEGYGYSREEEEITFEELGLEKRDFYFTHDYPYIGLKEQDIEPMKSIRKSLTPEEAKEIFEKALENVISKENSLSPMRYYQELESNPITIAIDSQSGKITLVDGYKRLLYITDKNLLDKEVAVRVFKDLSDKDLLTLLFTENSWKSMGINNRDIDFHDRGFLFSLKQRFGIEYSENLMKALYLYDKTGQLGNDITTHKALVSTATFSDVRDIATKNDNYVEDIKLLTKFLDETQEKAYPYEENIKEFVAYAVVSLVGYIRRKEPIMTELTMDMLEKAMMTEEVQKSYKKKKYSSDTYIENNFRDNHLKDALLNHLKELLENGKEIDEEVDMGR